MIKLRERSLWLRIETFGPRLIFLFFLEVFIFNSDHSHFNFVTRFVLVLTFYHFPLLDTQCVLHDRGIFVILHCACITVNMKLNHL